MEGWVSHGVYCEGSRREGMARRKEGGREGERVYQSLNVALFEEKESLPGRPDPGEKYYSWEIL